MPTPAPTKHNPALRSRSPRRQRPARRPDLASKPAAREPSGISAALDASAALNSSITIESFAALDLPASLVKVLAGRGITVPTPIQACAIPDALAGRDVLGRAQTGSGKTLAFGLPMLTRLSTAAPTRRTQRPRGLVLVPTRELARQVGDELEALATAAGLQTAAVFGGASIGAQIARLRHGIDVLIATPGRLLDLMERKAVHLDAVEVVTIDEADHMADLGFLPSVTRILDATSSREQCLLFSATLDRGVDRLVARYLAKPAMHAVASSSAPVEAMEHKVFLLRSEDKPAIAAEVAARPARTLFFVRTKHGADRLAKQLGKLGVKAAAIHGNLSQNQRLRALDGFSSGQTRVLVATNVAARGLHVDDLDLVVHYDPPNDHKDYLHRSGRTARAGATGTVVSFVESHLARDVARMHAAASVHPQVVSVRSGDSAVRRIAESGTPIDLTAHRPVATGPASGAPHSGPARAARGGAQRHRPDPRKRSGSPRRAPAARS